MRKRIAINAELDAQAQKLIQAHREEAERAIVDKLAHTAVNAVTPVYAVCELLTSPDPQDQAVGRRHIESALKHLVAKVAELFPESD